EVAHFNFGASRPCDVADGDQLAAVKLYLGAFSVRGSFSSKEQTRDRCNRRQRFASKTECSDGFEIISGTKLRRRVTFESDDSIVASHPLAVVEHADQPLTARLDFDVDRARAGIERIFEQFLHHRRRSFDYFPCGDFVGEGIWQYFDL